MTTDLFTLDCECGCAAKIPAAQLSGILRRLQLPRSADLLIGPETLDDGCVYRISADTCLIQTVDFFPPVARDPDIYGQIAAANALSDIYAMGGVPLTALAIVCFPAERLAGAVLEAMLHGAVTKITEAGAVLAGGHSIVDPVPKLGFAVTGTVRPDAILSNAGARPGNLLVLTKPLGVGTTILAAKAGLATAALEAEANRCMATLNATAARLARAHGATACTDITGFGFLGHAAQLANASGVSLDIDLTAIPFLEDAQEFAATGLLSAATYANRRHNANAVRFDAGIAQACEDLLFDPQTSGGLLIALPAERADAFMVDASRELTTSHAIVGCVTNQTTTAISVSSKGKGHTTRT